MIVYLIAGIVIGLGLSDLWRYYMARMNTRAAFQEMVRANEYLLENVTVEQLEEALRKKMFDQEMKEKENKKPEGKKNGKTSRARSN